ncbi:MAG: hypothetical protein EOP48_06060 [Sphingobacteriales bacterium]|nr:MAG: hypothetical protein EOP48_06060 [Sphingobacteriales bacterium]
MRKIVLVVLISSPAFAHQIQFNESAYLSINSDPATADALKIYCQSNGLTTLGCEDKFAGKGNLAAEAVLKCETIEQAKRIQFAFKTDEKDLMKKAHQVFGNLWHENIIDGHAHAYSAGARETAANSAFNKRLTEINNENSSFKGTTSSTSGTEMKGGFDAGIPNAFTIRFDFGGNNSKTITSPQITKAQIEDLKNAWLDGYNSPFRYDISPDSVTDVHGKVITGAQPANKKSAKEIKVKAEEKKGAENPPQHEDDRTKNIPEIKSTHVGKMAGESSIDVTGIATPAIEDLALQTPLEKCVDEQTKLLTDEMGKKTFDPNASAEDKVEADRAKTLTEHGYCDEQIFSREACAAKKFKEDSVVAVTIQEDRKEAASQALERFATSGDCDASALGQDFCRKQIEKWLVNPDLNIESEIDQNKN